MISELQIKMTVLAVAIVVMAVAYEFYRWWNGKDDSWWQE